MQITATSIRKSGSLLAVLFLFVMLSGCAMILRDPRGQGFEGIRIAYGHNILGQKVLVAQSAIRGETELRRDSEYMTLGTIIDLERVLEIELLAPELAEEIEWITKAGECRDVGIPLSSCDEKFMTFDEVADLFLTKALEERLKFKSDRTLPVKMQIKLIPEGYGIYTISRVKMNKPPLELTLAIPYTEDMIDAVEEDESAKFTLAMSLSMVLHELIHVYARESSPFRSMAEEEFYALTLDRCFRYWADGSMNIYHPQLPTPESTKMVNQMKTQVDSAANIEDVYAWAMDGRDFTRGLMAAVFLLLWAESHIPQWTEKSDGRYVHWQDLWCDLVLDDPRAVIDSWQSGMPNLIVQFLELDQSR